MSSTYVHYGTPSSLPSDYAILSRYAAAQTDPNEGAPPAHETDPGVSNPAQGEPDEFYREVRGEGETEPLLAYSSRRTSFPGGYLKPPKMSIGSAPEGLLPNAVNEASPLIPRIPEDVDGEAVNESEVVPVHALGEELKILSKYTLPGVPPYYVHYN
jgi:multidrug resistance protein, MATE family